MIQSPVDEALQDLAIPIRLDESFEYGCTRSGGDDLVFVLGETGQRLSYDIDEWDSDGKTVVWVRIPLLEPSTEHKLWMYYGNSEASPSSDPLGTWPSASGLGTQAVYHFGRDLDDARGLHHGETISDIVAPQYTMHGVAGHAIWYEDVLDGSQGDIPDTAEIDDAILESRAFTVTTWIRPTPNIASRTAFRVPVSRGRELWSIVVQSRQEYSSEEGEPDVEYIWFRKPTPATFWTFCMQWCGDLPAGTMVTSDHHSLSADAKPVIDSNVESFWHHVAIVYETLEDNVYRKSILVDGVLGSRVESTALVLNWAHMESHLGQIRIGSGTSELETYDPADTIFHGAIDELHIASEAWSDARIRAEYLYYGEDVRRGQSKLVSVATPQCQPDR